MMWRFRELMPESVIKRLHTSGGQRVWSDSFDKTIVDTDFIISTLIEDIDLMKTTRWMWSKIGDIRIVDTNISSRHFFRSRDTDSSA